MHDTKQLRSEFFTNPLIGVVLCSYDTLEDALRLAVRRGEGWATWVCQDFTQAKADALTEGLQVEVVR